MRQTCIRQTCISIDVDSLYCYQQIYGLDVDRQDNIMYEVGLRRFVDLMEEFGFCGTLFIVGRDINMGDNKQLISDFASRGFEIANHTFNHDYHITKLSDNLLDYEVKAGKEALEDLTGQAVYGFRAPGYNMNERLLRAVSNAGHSYDSSAFPCIPYYLTKAAVLAAMTLSGKRSQSILGNARVLTSPLAPYRPSLSACYSRGDADIWELPISTSPFLRFPFLGSFLIMMGEKMFPMIYKMLMAQSQSLMLEFHAMDFIDAKRDGLEDGLHKQPDAAVSWKVKEKLFRKVFSEIKKTSEVLVASKLVDALTKEDKGGRDSQRGSSQS